ncbi:MAG TPA: hypothetical protein VF505_13300 [Thermoanaerobaculia bacterium]
MTSFEPLLRTAIIRGIDAISRRAAGAEKAAEGALGKLLKRWNDMDTAEKEQLAGIVVATATTAIGALAALKSRSKSVKKKAKKTARKAAKVVKKVV